MLQQPGRWTRHAAVVARAAFEGDSPVASFLEGSLWLAAQDDETNATTHYN